MLTGYARYRKYKSAFMSALAVFCAILVVTPLGLILFHLLKQGFSSLDWNFFTQLPRPEPETGGGMANAIVGSLEIIGLAMALAIPVGVLGGIYLSEYGSEKINFWIRFGADILNGVPSIVWGMTASAIAVIPFHTKSAYAGALALGFIAVPLILRTTEEVLVLVPNSYREAAMALGIPRWKIIVHIILRTAMKGLVTGVLLATGRIAGETAPLIFTVLGNDYWNHNLAQPIAALPLQVYNYAKSAYEDQHQQAWAGALVLIFMVFLLSVGVRVIATSRKRN